MRVLTRADLDGLVCAVLIKKTENIQDVRFSEPKFVQDGEVEIGPEDILANLPYDPRCGMWFDHHIANTKPKDFKGHFKTAPSAARVVYDYYLPNFPDLSRYDELIKETDKIDAAELTYAEVMEPERYLLLSMTIDGKYYDEKSYWLHLIELLSEKDINNVMQDNLVQAKCKSFLEENEKYKEIVRTNSKMEKNVLITDLRQYDELPRGNRYFLYAFQSATNLSLKISNDPERPGQVAIGVGYNIFNKTANINIGQLLKKYGGGGHKAVGSTRVPKEKVDEVIQELLKYLIER
jgi:oligoribonuclease NrnB/cAMP/cGMP phosphodiesterase (DHH superfamily)